MQLADESLFFLIPDTDKMLAFGLRWFPLVGSQAVHQARVRARALGGTHYVAGGLRAAAGGCARLSGVTRRRQVYAAAQVFAQLYTSGRAATCVAALPDGRYWLVAAQDGAVAARADRCYENELDAHQALRELQERQPGLQVLTAENLYRALLSGLDASSLLLPVQSRWAGVPLPVRVVMLSLAVSMAWPPTMELWRRFRSPPLAIVQEVDPVQGWQSVAKTFMQRTPVHRPQALQAALAALARLPLDLRGWALQAAQCHPTADAWACNARYLRLGHDATNEALSRLVPAGWELSFEPLDQASIAWHVPLQQASLFTSPPLSRVNTEMRLASELQRIRPLFTQVAMGRPVVVSLAPPVDAQGRPVPMPTSVQRLWRRSLTLAGPMRSFLLWSDAGSATTWSELTLELEHPRRPDIATSALFIRLEGAIYERE
jgi:hypothetical protein